VLSKIKNRELSLFFWAAVAAGNGFAVVFALRWFSQASTVPDAIFSAFVLLFVIALLVVVDSLCLVFADQHSRRSGSKGGNRADNVIPFAAMKKCRRA
jgi:hypothetical protein